MSHRLDDSGLCPVCGVAPCREAPVVITGGNVAETRVPDRVPVTQPAPSGRTADVDPVVERMYTGWLGYETAADHLGPQSNSGS